MDKHDEKNVYNANEQDVEGSPLPNYDKERTTSAIHARGASVAEGADLYGDIAAAERYGYVTRG